MVTSALNDFQTETEIDFSGKPDALSYNNASFLCSAAHYKDMPKPLFMEYCILGRSNVGKSSFINHVLERRNLAHVSKLPGKTKCANFFKIHDTMIWVDLPGYGYAKTSHAEKIRWSKLIKEYCEKRENLYGVIWLIDIRHIGMKADVEAFNWLAALGLPVFPVITKSDKLTQGKCVKNVREIESCFNVGSHPVVYSIHKNSSRKKFWEAFVAWVEQRASTRKL